MLITHSDLGGTKYVLDVDHSELFFGSLLVGSSSEPQTITMTNKGWNDISLKEITISGSAFSLEGDNPGVLRPSQKVTFSVSFSPVASGAFTGSVFIDAGVTGKGYIRLFGAGFAVADGGNDITGVPVFETAAELTSDAALNYANGTIVFIINDPELENNGFYRKQGVSGTGDYDGPLSAYSELLGNAQRDMADIEKVILGPDDLPNPGHPAGTVTLRNGETYRTVANIIGLQTIQEQAANAAAIIASDAANRAETARDEAQDWTEGTSPGGPGTKSAKEYSEEFATTLSASGKNIADPSLIKAGWGLGAAPNYTIASGSSSQRSIVFVPVKPLHTYTVSGIQPTLGRMSASVTSVKGVNSTFLGSASSTGRHTVTIPAGHHFLTVVLTNSTTGNTTYDGTVQIEEGETVTAYEPFERLIGEDRVEGLVQKLNFDQVLELWSHNMFNPSGVDFTRRYATGTHSIVAADANFLAISPAIEVRAGQFYCVSGGGFSITSGVGWGGFFDSPTAIIALNNITWGNPPMGPGRIFQAQADGWVRFNVRTTAEATPTARSIYGPVQMEEGEVATNWVPFAEQERVKPSLISTNTGGGGSGGTATLDQASWFKFLEGEQGAHLLDNIPGFRDKWMAKTEDVLIIGTGTSLFARTTEHNSPHPRAMYRPPLMHSINCASHFWDRFAWAGQQYRRYDVPGFFTETGTFATAHDLAEWDDGAYRNGLTRYSASANASVAFTVPVGAWQFNFIYRTDSVGCTNTVTIAGGNALLQVWNGSAWVEANGYTFSTAEATPVTRTVNIPSTTTASTTPTVLASKGNTTYQQRLKFRARNNGGSLDSRTSAKSVTIARTGGGARFSYWGVEWSPREYMVTFINSARGSHNTSATSNLGLPRYQDNEVWGYGQPDLIFGELAIHNDGAVSMNSSYAGGHWAGLANNYLFRADYELSVAGSASRLGKSMPEIFMIHGTVPGTVSIGAIDADGQLVFKDTTDVGSKRMQTSLDRYAEAHDWIVDNHPEAVSVLTTQRWVDAGFAIYGDLKTAMTGSGPGGDTMMSDGTHPNTTGGRIWAKAALGVLWGMG